MVNSLLLNVKLSLNFSVKHSLTSNTSVDCDPQKYKEVMASRDGAFWREAINNEMNSVMSNNIWVLVDLPPGSKVIGYNGPLKGKNDALSEKRA